MLKILGEHYYLDLDKIDEYIQVKTHPEPQTEVIEEPGTQINIAKYETIKLMLEVLLEDSQSIDETLGGKSSEITIPFKFAFNTLLNKKILNKY